MQHSAVPRVDDDDDDVPRLPMISTSTYVDLRVAISGGRNASQSHRGTIRSEKAKAADE